MAPNCTRFSPLDPLTPAAPFSDNCASSALPSASFTDRKSSPLGPSIPSAFFLDVPTLSSLSISFKEWEPWAVDLKRDLEALAPVEVSQLFGKSNPSRMRSARSSGFLVAPTAPWIPTAPLVPIVTARCRFSSIAIAREDFKASTTRDCAMEAASTMSADFRASCLAKPGKQDAREYDKTPGCSIWNQGFT